MKLARKIGIVLLALLVVGFLKRPLEDTFAKDLRERRLLLKPIDTGLIVFLDLLQPLLEGIINIVIEAECCARDIVL